ncbi:hypothetical protein HOLleu_34305 [Holothuria leucospilota]|uniref:Immunoglobulin domain-containing protein n=1 Tax=Holothuria leucospilota TaxID=206669 RepID=A0A9Q0YPL2_HOLLE|nr:hypothetical protein HOLleu_34305 [Holothuria leucospilota]
MRLYGVSRNNSNPKCGLLGYYFVSFVLFKTSFSGVDHGNITVPVNESVILPCNVENPDRSIWLVTKKNSPSNARTLTSGLITFDSHLHTLNVKSNTNFFTYNLIINAARQDMEGIYICKEEGVQRSKRLLFVDVPPTVWLEFNNSKLSDTLDVIMNKEYEIRCWAEGGRPPVTLSWEIDNNTVTEGTQQLQADGSTVSTVIKYRPRLHDAHLSCRTGGQQIVSNIQSDVFVNVMYKPMCDISVQHISDQLSNTYQITCVCLANPRVAGVFLATNNSMYMGKSTIILKTNYPTRTLCKGRNVVGFSETARKTISPLRIKEASFNIKVSSTIPLFYADISSFKHLSDKPQVEEWNMSFVVIITSLAILVLILVLALVAVAKVSKSRLKSEEITSYYFAGDVHENGNVLTENRSRLPSPEIPRKHTEEDEQMYECPRMDQRKNLTTDPQGVREVRSYTSASYVRPDVQETELPFQPGSVTLQAKGQTRDTGMYNDITTPTTDLSSERTLELPSTRREPPIRTYATVDKRLKTKPSILNETSYGFSDAVIRQWAARPDIPSMASWKSSFSDSSYFAFDVNAVPCEIYERYSKICKERWDSVRRGKNTMSREKNISEIE